MARYNCTSNGEWQDLNTSVCPYISETTRILQQYAKMNLSSGKANVVESARRLQNYTLDNRSRLVDPMDIVYITQTIHNYLEFVEKEKELGSLLLDLVSNTMELDAKVLAMAQREDQSCSKLLSTVEMVTQFTPSLLSHKSNMAVEGFRVSRESFLGLTCTWWNGPDRLFQCSTSDKSAVRVTNDKLVEGSIQIPASLLHQLESWGKPAGGTHQLMVSMYDTARLFPASMNTTLSSSVVGTKLVGVEGNFELSEPVVVMLGGGGTPVWWDADKSQWLMGPCQPYRLLSDLLVLHCRRLGYFTLLMEPPTFHSHRVEQAFSRLSSPSVYFGTFIGSTCLLISAFTYAVCHSSIQMSARLKHSLANTWTAISLLSIIFSLGMYQTRDLYYCRAVGLSVHYLTLSVLFWMAVTINGLHRAVRKPDSSAPIVTGSDDGGDLGGGQPIVGLYLVGWGVAALLVGLSGAVNPAGYAAPTYCSLTPGPAFMPVLVPVTALLVFIFIRFLMEKDSNAQLSEGTQATDLELLETGGGVVSASAGLDDTSVHSVATPSSHIEDPEHSPGIQLKAFLIVHVLYSFVWITGALSVLKPIGLPHEETLFATCYALFIILLGSFVVFFYCFSRSDVRGVWFTLKPMVRSRNVTDSHAAPPPLISSRNSVTSASIAVKSVEPPQDSTVQKVNLVDLHRRQYHTNHSVITNGADSFYNPHQSVVARKFFRRQRRKQNGLGARRCGDGATPGSPDNWELFHLGGGGHRPLERLVIGAESDDAPPAPKPQPPPLPFGNDSSAKYYASVASECCSCVVSEVHSTTDCTRDLTTSEHSSRSSHLYATVAPDSSPPLVSTGPSPGRAITIDAKNEVVRIRMADPIGPSNCHTSDEDKKETCV
ncbi:hypothetical protein AAG570_002794 [Ranatra chinensis]|uniref:GAIN-B domain-containing protein n=1 Tax=Ranatra chinensis TaxID=642074 RepID=A0ABD0Y4X0_9HEMI